MRTIKAGIKIGTIAYFAFTTFLTLSAIDKGVTQVLEAVLKARKAANEAADPLTEEDDSDDLK